MDRNDFIIVGILLSVLLGSFYITYRTGRWLERQDYTKAFVGEVETAYWQGYDDGQQMGRKQGLALGYKKCLDEDYKQTDNY